IFFTRMKLGLHGNLYLKMQAFEEVSRIDTGAYYREFLGNRQKSEVISNMFARVYFKNSNDYLQKIAAKIRDVYVHDARQLQIKLKKMLNLN
ncbi:MAG: hypothetical protein GY757_00315, partial [bacterium]|nr:hypothetical protein [bacterium]